LRLGRHLHRRDTLLLFLFLLPPARPELSPAGGAVGVLDLLDLCLDPAEQAAFVEEVVALRRLNNFSGILKSVIFCEFFDANTTSLFLLNLFLVAIEIYVGQRGFDELEHASEHVFAVAFQAGLLLADGHVLLVGEHEVVDPLRLVQSVAHVAEGYDHR